METKPNLVIAVALSWLASGTIGAAIKQFEAYRKGSPARHKLKQQEGNVHARMVDVQAELELLLSQHYTSRPEMIELMKEIGMGTRKIVEYLATSDSHQQVVKLWTIIDAALADEVNVVDEKLTASQYQLTLTDGRTATINKVEGGWICDLLPGRRTEASYFTAAFEQLGLA